MAFADSGPQRMLKSLEVEPELTRYFFSPELLF